MRKDSFILPEGVIYLDGNSLGPLPAAAMQRLKSTVADEWGELLIRAWNKAGWMQMPARLGDRIAPLIGAPEGSVMVGDTLSIKVYQALDAALKLRPDRNVVLSDNGNFPSDLYMAEGLLKTIGRDIELRVVAPEAVADNVDEQVAVLMLTEADYRTGRLHDMAMLTRRAHEAGAVTIWDLAHTAGAMPIDVDGCSTEFAVGCTYKYLNGGPGAPAFIYVRPDIADSIDPGLSGWLGHAEPFAFDLEYRPAPATERMRVGTPPVLQMAVLDTALDVWEGLSMQDLRDRSITLSELFIKRVEKNCPQLKLMSPRDPQQRGSQVSFAFDHGYEVMQALIARGVIGDFRAPDMMRFGFTPLYLDEGDIKRAVAILTEIMDDEVWREPEYGRRSLVT